MVLRLAYLHAAGLVALPLLIDGISNGNSLFNLVGPAFAAVAVVLFLSMLIYTLKHAHLYSYYIGEATQVGVVRLGASHIGSFYYPLLGLWAYGLFGPTTPAPQKPARQSAKG
jgi:hypothetical protein